MELTLGETRTIELNLPLHDFQIEYQDLDNINRFHLIEYIEYYLESQTGNKTSLVKDHGNWMEYIGYFQLCIYQKHTSVLKCTIPPVIKQLENILDQFENHKLFMDIKTRSTEEILFNDMKISPILKFYL